MFYCREEELSKLEKRYRSGGFECVIIYGRRRIGKTALIDEFCKDKKCIFFSAINGTAQENIEALSGAVYGYDHPGSGDTLSFGSIQRALQEVTGIARRERVVFVIDEYPYLADAEPSVSSRLQHLIDHEWGNTSMFLILCGSSMSFMEEQVLGYESPLYGRRTAQLKLQPLTYRDTAAFHPGLSDENHALVYGIAGGIPLYVKKLYNGGDLDTSVLENVFDPAAYLYEEPENLLKQELREPAAYSTILLAIAQGASRMNDIAMKAGVTTAACSKYLNNLIKLGIVMKETPFSEKEGKKTIYRISDQYFRFWYRFVRKNISAINTGQIAKSYETMIRSHYNDHMGQVFEQMCKDYLLYYDDHLPMVIADIGRWWGTDSATRREVEIDLVANAADRDAFLFASCKYRNEKTDVEELIRLKEYAAVFGKGEQRYYYLFSKSGFTASLKKVADDTVRLVDLKEMYR